MYLSAAQQQHLRYSEWTEHMLVCLLCSWQAGTYVHVQRPPGGAQLIALPEFHSWLHVVDVQHAHNTGHLVASSLRQVRPNLLE